MPFRPASIALASLLLCSGVLLADQVDDALEKIAAYREGISALSQNKNEVASIRLREVAAMELSTPAKLRVLGRIAEAEIRNKRFGPALELFAEPGLASDPQASYWHALALIGSERAGDAEKILAGITSQKDHPQWAEATLTRTSLLLRFGASEEAIKILAPLIESGSAEQVARARLRAAEIRLNQEQWEDVEKLLAGFGSSGSKPNPQLDYLRARLSIGLEDWTKALALLQGLNKPKILASLSPDMRDGVTIAIARVFMNKGDTESASNLIKKFIGANPESPNLIAAFETLEEIGAFKGETIDEQLVDWANSPARNLAATATYFLAIAQTTAVNEDAAANTLEAIRSNFADHPIAERALLQLSEIYVANANKPQALSVLADLREISTTPAVLARINFIEARAEFAVGEFKLAADKFALAATADQPAAAAATFDSAIAALKANDIELFNQRRQMLGDIGETSLSADLQLERALFSARPGQPGTDASAKLTQFLVDHPDHRRRAEGHLALAYLQLNQDVPKLVSARSHLEQAREAPLLPAFEEEADYTAFWIETKDNSGDSKPAIAAAEQFIERHPGSARAPEILFKLGGIHFRDGSFPDSQTQFERLALDYPTSPRAEIALFTAGRAATRIGTSSSIERAVQIFKDVAERGGEFAISAKLQQALVFRSQLKEEEAIAILDSIISRDKPEGELLFSTLIAKGEALFILGEEKPASLAAAIQIFESTTQQKNISTFWLNQALTRKGNALERAGEVGQALVAYEEVISRPRPPLDSDEVPDYVWFYKAGFAAIRIYEERNNWEAAIRTADILASTDGPGAQAARQRSQQLETKNFIWRD